MAAKFHGDAQVGNYYSSLNKAQKTYRSAVDRTLPSAILRGTPAKVASEPKLADFELGCVKIFDDVALRYD
jgi:hypothetical protein